MTKLYLDIDGVLLRKDGKPAAGLVEFLAYVTKRYEFFNLSLPSAPQDIPTFLRM